MKISKKTEERFQANVPKFQKVLTQAKARDLNESDTVTIITDVLAEVFGWEKYLEITSEFAVRGTYCDLALKTGDKFHYLIECKAIGVDLNEKHLKQARDYGANKGIQWVILTNGVDWQIHRIRFEQPINSDLVVRFNLLAGNIKDDKFVEQLFVIAKEGVEKSLREEIFEKIQCVNRFVIGSLLLSDPVINMLKRELRRVADGIKIEDTEIIAMLKDGVLRRDLIDGGETAAERAKAVKLLKISTTAPVKKTAVKKTDDPVSPVAPAPENQAPAPQVDANA